MPAAAVIPALLAYVNVAAVKTLVVGVEDRTERFRKKLQSWVFFVVCAVNSAAPVNLEKILTLKLGLWSQFFLHGILEYVPVPRGW